MEKLHLQPSELDAMPYYEYEYTMEMYNIILKERKEIEDKNTQSTRDKYNTANLYKGTNSAMKSFKPQTPNIKMPKI